MSFIQFIYFPVTTVICPALQPKNLPFWAIVEFYRESKENCVGRS